MKSNKYFLLIVFILSIGILYAQRPEKSVDELKKELKRAIGVNKINVLNELSIALVKINPEDGLKYAREGLSLAETMRKDTLKASLINAIGMNLWGLSNYKEADIYFRKALKLAIKYKDSITIAKVYNNIGLIYEASGEYDSCIIMFKKQLEIYRKMKLFSESGTALENIGTIHFYRGELKSAITWLLQAKDIYQKYNLDKKYCYVLIKIGGVYSESKEYKTAEKFFKEGVKLAMKTNEFAITAIGLNSLGIVYKLTDKFDLALEKYFEAIEIANQLGNKILLMKIYSNVGNIYTLQEKFNLAKNYHLKALKIAEEVGMPNQIAIHSVNLGEVFFKQKDYINARSYYQKAIPIFTENKTYANLLQAYTALIKVNNELKDYKQSVTYYNLYIALKDSLDEYENNATLDSLKVQFNTEHTELKNKSLQQENEIKDKTIFIQRITILAVTLLIVIIVFFVYYIIKSDKKIKVINLQLEQKNKEILVQSEEINKVNVKLKELSDLKDLLNSFLVHDLKTPLNTIININTKNPDELQLQTIKNSGKQMLNLVMNILEISKFENNAFKLNKSFIALSAVLSNSVNDIRFPAHQKSLRIKQLCHHDYQVNIDSDIIERVLVNLLTNAIKFSPKGEQIEINCQLIENNYIIISVKDNGSGIEPDYLEKIFNRFSKIPSNHSGIKRSTGIGLTFCKMAVEAHGGNIGVNSIPGQGSEFWFTLPYIQSEFNTESSTSDCKLVKENKFPDFTDKEIIYLKQFQVYFKDLSIYQVTDVKKALDLILNENNSLNISDWKMCVLRAVQNCDEVRFKMLIKIISDE